LRRGQRNFDYIDAKQSGVWVFIRRVTRTPGHLFTLTHERCAGHVDIDVVLVLRIDHERMRVRAAASLHCGYLLRILDVGYIEDPHTAEAIALRRGKARLFLFAGGRRWV